MSEFPSTLTKRASGCKKEAHVKMVVKDTLTYFSQLYSKSIWWMMPVSNGMGRHGIPDFIICFYGLFLAIETKFNGTEPTGQQAENLNGIIESDGIAFVVDESNIGELYTTLCSVIEYLVQLHNGTNRSGLRLACFPTAAMRALQSSSGDGELLTNAPPVLQLQRNRNGEDFNYRVEFTPFNALGIASARPCRRAKVHDGHSLAANAESGRQQRLDTRTTGRCGDTNGSLQGLLRQTASGNRHKS